MLIVELLHLTDKYEYSSQFKIVEIGTYVILQKYYCENFRTLSEGNCFSTSRSRTFDC